MDDEQVAIGKRGRRDAAAVREAFSAAGGIDELLSRTPTAANMRRLWEACWKRRFPGQRVGGWQFKHESHMAKMGREYPNSLQLIAHAIDNWGMVLADVKDRTGDKGPKEPASWFVARHARIVAESVGNEQTVGVASGSGTGLKPGEW